MTPSNDTATESAALRPGTAPGSRPGQPPFQVLYVVASDRSGSTLLQSLLGLQPRFVAVGEIRRIGSLSREGRPCGCGAPIPECPFWSQIALRLGQRFENVPTEIEFEGLRRRLRFAAEWLSCQLGVPGLAAALSPIEVEAARNTLRIHQLVAEATGCQVIIDSSKTRSLFLHMLVQAPDQLRPMFLIRDGRGVVWSKMRRTGATVQGAISRWVELTQMQLALRKVVPPEWRQLIRYEDLCRSTRETLGQVLRPLGVQVSTTDLAEFAGKRHDLGGSPRFNQTIPQSIELDERWKTEMPDDVRREFDRRASAINRRIGYE